MMTAPNMLQQFAIQVHVLCTYVLLCPTAQAQEAANSTKGIIFPQQQQDEEEQGKDPRTSEAYSSRHGTTSTGGTPATALASFLQCCPRPGSRSRSCQAILRQCNAASHWAHVFILMAPLHLVQGLASSTSATMTGRQQVLTLADTHLGCKREEASRMV